MNRLSKHLSPLEKAEVCNAFQRRLMVADAIQRANEILIRKGKKQVGRDGIEIFLKETAPHLWQAFKIKTPEKSIIARTSEEVKNIVSAFTGKKPDAHEDPQAPDSIRYGSDVPRRKSHRFFGMREEESPEGLEPDEVPYHNKMADEALLRELLPDYETRLRKEALERRKKQEKDSS